MVSSVDEDLKVVIPTVDGQNLRILMKEQNDDEEDWEPVKMRLGKYSSTSYTSLESAPIKFTMDHFTM